MNLFGVRMVCFVACLMLVTALASQVVSAQTPSGGTVTGIVRTTAGQPVGGAAVALRGASSQATTTDSQGRFRFANVAPGFYDVIVSKAGFLVYVASIAMTSGQSTSVEVALSAQSFSSLRTIAHAQTAVPGYSGINQSTASIYVVPGQAFIDQGQTQVSKVLNEVPGIIVWASPGSNNGADQFSPQTIQVRNALPYETESLIDGHMTPLSLTGTFDPSLLNPAMLQNVEIVKGPGSMPEEINYAVGGTVNFVTLDPTRTPQAELTAGIDGWGGVTTSIRLTGSIPSDFLQYAFAYATDGAPGPMRNYQLPGSAVFLVAGTDWTVNGQSLDGLPYGAGLAPEKSYNEYVGTVGELRYQEPFYVCCYGFNTDFDSKNELAKLRLNFSQVSSFTMSFLGGQDFGHTNNVGVAASYAPVGTLSGSSFSSFVPPAGYTGSVPSGTQLPFDLSAFAPGYGSVQQYLYQGEFRTTIGDWTALARYYDGGNVDYTYFNNPSSGLFAFTGHAWGGAALCPKGTTANLGTGLCDPGGVAPTETYFNGQLTTFQASNATNQSLIDNHERGETLQFDRPFGNGALLTLAADRSSLSGYEFVNVPTSGVPPYYSFPPGASQLFTTESLRFTFFVAPLLQAEVGNYAIQYSSHFTDNGGGILPGSGPASWKDSTRGYDAPRVGFTWQPNDDTSWRLALGTSIAPPFLSLLSSPGSTPAENINGVPTAGYTEDLNNGNIAPETAFGYDLGYDRRIHRTLFVSLDAYLTNLRNMYLPSTFLVNQDYYPASCSSAGLSPGQCPLFASQTENLGHARYEGLEFAFGSAPLTGLGFRIQGDLTRAYAYDLEEMAAQVRANTPAGQSTAAWNY